ncbi:MAG: toll/interleukin-1 receptor domain-containing protein [Nitrospirae bacterium]|nr:MAG: toll/interleukin-1 receptor domain-containing protein [Nitrospirota bacterium]
MANLFFSYSHRDADLRDELEIHLATLKMEGVIEIWHERRIGAGKEFGNEISQHLEEANIILLLISPYFIASDYCYEIEMKRAMQRHEKGDARVIPVILEPCDWQKLPFGKLTATPTDGKPISKFPNKHDGFLDVTRAIQNAAEDFCGPEQGKPVEMVTMAEKRRTTKVARPRSSNLRLKKEFTDRDKDSFLTDAFEYVANFFEGSLDELQKRNPGIETNFRRIDANHFTAVAYRHGKELSRCRIWLGNRREFVGGIAYSTDLSHGDNSYNESLSVEDDGYTLFLKPLGMAFRHQGSESKLTFEGAGEYLWEMFIEPLQ